jgi:Fe2+ or Zn2+ uptake regulation protein
MAATTSGRLDAGKEGRETSQQPQRVADSPVPPWRLTAQRAAVVAALQEADHPTAEELVARLAGQVSTATVYNTLGALKARGLVAVLDGPDGRRFDVKVEPHPHVRCDGCGRVRDVAVPALPDWGQGVLPAGWRATGMSVVLHGICPDCREAMAP